MHTIVLSVIEESRFSDDGGTTYTEDYEGDTKLLNGEVEDRHQISRTMRKTLDFIL